MTIGQKVKVYSASKGITQRYLGNAAGVSDNRITNVLKGKSEISVFEYYSICKALNVPLEFFFEDKTMKNLWSISYLCYIQEPCFEVPKFKTLKY